MPTCPKCCAETKKDDKFCGSCGASLTTEEKPPREKYVQEREVCFEAERRGDYTGLISFGIFLLIVGIIFVNNPNVISEFANWVSDMSDAQSFLRPPQTLLFSGALFFSLIGVSSFVVAAIRFVAHGFKRRVLSDALNGIGLLVFGYLLYLYSNGTIRGFAVIATEILVIGILVIVYAATRHLVTK